MVLTKLFEKIKDINDSVENIQYGGCGIFAQNIYNILTRLGYQPKIIVITKTLETIEDWVLKNNKDPYYFDVTHIVIELDGVYIDNNGVYLKTTSIMHCDDENLKVTDIVTPVVLKEWVDNLHWNQRFDRRDVSVIEHKLNQVYELFEKDLVVSN